MSREERTRPAVEPAVLAELAACAPRRLVKALDADPGTAERWTWKASPGGAWEVRTDTGERVVLRPGASGRIASLAEASCTCLLAPRCLHLLAVVSRLEPGESAEDPSPVPAEGTAPPPAPGESGIDPAGRDAARLAFHVASEVVEIGASACGTAVQAELLRAVHACRAAGLPRPGAAGLAVLRGIRDLREGRPEFELAAYAESLLELLETAAVLGGALLSTPAGHAGVARRAYAEAGNLRLAGLFSEPVVASSGAAGVVTYLVDSGGRLWSVSDVQPGEPSRARAAYEKGVRLGGTSISHRELSRAGLYVQDATASAGGRLGSGASVKAVRAEGSPWSEGGAGLLFAEPLASQIERAHRAADLAPAERPAGSDLLFLRAVVAGAHREGLLVLVGEAAILATAPSDHAVLAFRDNLALLARAPGLPLRLAGRFRPGRPRTLSLLAVAPDPGTEEETRLELPEEWGARVNAGLDLLQATHVRGIQRAAPLLETPGGPCARSPAEALAPLSRRLHRLALGGRSTLPPEAASAVESEARALGRCLLPAAAGLLVEIHQEAVRAPRGLAGMREPSDPERLALRYLEAGIYLRAASRALERSRWLEQATLSS